MEYYLSHRGLFCSDDAYVICIGFCFAGISGYKAVSTITNICDGIFLFAFVLCIGSDYAWEGKRLQGEGSMAVFIYGK